MGGDGVGSLFLSANASPPRHPGESRDPAPLLRSCCSSRNPPHVPVFFHSPSLASESLSLACPRESNQREGHPGCGAAAARRFATGGRVPLTAHPVPQRNRRDPSRRPFGPFRPPSAAPHGAQDQEHSDAAFIGWALAHRGENGGPRPTLSFDFGVPLGRGEDAEEKARRVAGRMPASSLSGHGWPVSEPP